MRAPERGLEVRLGPVPVARARRGDTEQRSSEAVVPAAHEAFGRRELDRSPRTSAAGLVDFAEHVRTLRRPRRRGPTRLPEFGAAEHRELRARLFDQRRSPSRRLPRYAWIKNSRPRWPPAAPRISSCAPPLRSGARVSSHRPRQNVASPMRVWPTDDSHAESHLAARARARTVPRSSRTAGVGMAPDVAERLALLGEHVGRPVAESLRERFALAADRRPPLRIGRATRATRRRSRGRWRDSTSRPPCGDARCSPGLRRRHSGYW